MAEYIEREAVLATCKGIAACSWNKKAAPVSWSDAYEHFADMLDEAPAADVVEVVRCKNCRESYYISQMFGESLFCAYWKKDTDEDGYCHEGV